MLNCPLTNPFLEHLRKEYNVPAWWFTAPIVQNAVIEAVRSTLQSASTTKPPSDGTASTPAPTSLDSSRLSVEHVVHCAVPIAQAMTQRWGDGSLHRSKRHKFRAVSREEAVVLAERAFAAAERLLASTQMAAPSPIDAAVSAPAVSSVSPATAPVSVTVDAAVQPTVTAHAQPKVAESEPEPLWVKVPVTPPEPVSEPDPLSSSELKSRASDRPDLGPAYTMLESAASRFVSLLQHRLDETSPADMADKAARSTLQARAASLSSMEPESSTSESTFPARLVSLLQEQLRSTTAAPSAPSSSDGPSSAPRSKFTRFGHMTPESSSQFAATSAPTTSPNPSLHGLLPPRPAPGAVGFPSSSLLTDPTRSDERSIMENIAHGDATEVVFHPLKNNLPVPELVPELQAVLAQDGIHVTRGLHAAFAPSADSAQRDESGALLSDSELLSVVPAAVARSSELDADEDVDDLDGSSDRVRKALPAPRVATIPPYYYTIRHPSQSRPSSIPAFVTASRDEVQQLIARGHGCSIIASTSSISPLLSAIYFVWSGFRPVNTQSFSFAERMPVQFTSTTRRPAVLLLRNRSIKPDEGMLYVARLSIASVLSDCVILWMLSLVQSPHAECVCKSMWFVYAFLGFSATQIPTIRPSFGGSTVSRIPAPVRTRSCRISATLWNAWSP
jgi:hypothetical protein